MVYPKPWRGLEIAIFCTRAGKVYKMLFPYGSCSNAEPKFYWKEELSYTGVSSILSRNWFESIIRSIHFVNNLTVDRDTKKVTNIGRLDVG